MLLKLLLYYHTIRHLRCIQVRYQIRYRFLKIWHLLTNHKYDYSKTLPIFERINIQSSIYNYRSYFGNFSFRFLNQDHRFNSKIDWDFFEYGKLWTYNLNYFEFLNQDNGGKYKEEYQALINEYKDRLPLLKNGNESFPASLRIINWIKFLIKNEIENISLSTSLFSQCHILRQNIEYHLMGNHLLENGFALTMGGIFFQDKILFMEGRHILARELEEQILDDGAHFELSPMYHCLMLNRLLDLINLMRSNKELINKGFSDQDQFFGFLVQKAGNMCGWLQAVSYEDGSYPHFNDSTEGVAPPADQLLDYADKLDVLYHISVLKGSGYRRLKNESFDLTIKAGNIGPDYIPGHAHADSLSFVCHVRGVPLIVDPGISTYEKNTRRQEERSTSYHNTVSINKHNSSQVWGGFRVGKRAEVKIKDIDKKSITAKHNGFSSSHIRSIALDTNYIEITDKIKLSSAEAHFHFHPEVKIELAADQIRINDHFIEFENAGDIAIKDYFFSMGYNRSILAQKITVSFQNHLKTIIRL